MTGIYAAFDRDLAGYPDDEWNDAKPWEWPDDLEPEDYEFMDYDPELDYNEDEWKRGAPLRNAQHWAEKARTELEIHLPKASDAAPTRPKSLPTLRAPMAPPMMGPPVPPMPLPGMPAPFAPPMMPGPAMGNSWQSGSAGNELTGGSGDDVLAGGAGVDRLADSLARLEDDFRQAGDGGTVLGQTFGTLGTQVRAGAQAHDQFAQSLTRGLEVGPAVSEMFGGLTQGLQGAGTGLASLTEGLGTSGGALTLWGEQANASALMAGAGVDGSTARLDGSTAMIETIMTGRLPTAANIFGTLMNQGALSASDGFRMFGEVASTSSNRVAQVAGQAFQGVGNALSGIVTGSMSAKEAFSGLAKSVLENVADMAMSSGSLGGFGDILGKGMDFLGLDFGDILSWLPFKHGGVFDHGRLKRFARGGVVSRPTLFPMAKGAGLMGEAGPEAVMPLTRLPGGDLGVRAFTGQGGASGRGGGSVPVTVNVNNQSGTPATAQAQAGRGGAGDLDVVVKMIEDKLAHGVPRRTSLSQAFERIYGLRRIGY